MKNSIKEMYESIICEYYKSCQFEGDCPDRILFYWDIDKLEPSYTCDKIPTTISYIQITPFQFQMYQASLKDR